jgi:hypothetical protein
VPSARSCSTVRRRGSGSSSTGRRRGFTGLPPATPVGDRRQVAPSDAGEEAVAGAVSSVSRCSRRSLVSSGEHGTRRSSWSARCLSCLRCSRYEPSSVHSRPASGVGARKWSSPQSSAGSQSLLWARARVAPSTQHLPGATLAVCVKTHGSRLLRSLTAGVTTSSDNGCDTAGVALHAITQGLRMHHGQIHERERSGPWGISEPLLAVVARFSPRYRSAA